MGDVVTATSETRGPRLAIAGMGGDWEGEVGDELDVLVRVRNDGEGGRGLAVQVWGHALEQGLVEPLDVQLGDVTAPLCVPDEARPAVHRAELPDIDVPAGSSPDEPAGSALPGAPAHADFEVTVRVRALAPAWTQLFVALVPHEARQGQAATAAMLSLSPRRDA